MLIRSFLDELYGVIKGMVMKEREKSCDDIIVTMHAISLRNASNILIYEDLGLLCATCKKWANNI